MKGGFMASKQEYTKKEVSKTLKETGYLKVKEIDQHPDLPSHSTVLNLFKTTKITNVWKELDIPFTSRPSYTKEEVSKALKETGYLPQKDINQHPDFPSCGTIVKLFKTTKMSDVWEELDIPIVSQSSYTKESVVKVLKETGWLSTKEIGQHIDLPSRDVIVRLFKTSKINDVWKELDIFGI